MLSDISTRLLAFRILQSAERGRGLQRTISYVLVQAMKSLRSVVLLWQLDTRLLLKLFLLKGSPGKSQTSGLFYLRRLKDKENTLV